MNEYNDYEPYVSDGPITGPTKANDLPWLIKIVGMPLVGITGLYLLSLIF